MALKEFIAKAEAPGADAGVDAGDLKPEEAIKLANELRAKGESKKAEEIFLEVLKKNPTNADAAAGLGDIARSRSESGTGLPWGALRMMTWGLSVRRPKERRGFFSSSERPIIAFQRRE